MHLVLPDCDRGWLVTSIALSPPLFEAECVFLGRPEPGPQIALRFFVDKVQRRLGHVVVASWARFPLLVGRPAQPWRLVNRQRFGEQVAP